VNVRLLSLWVLGVVCSLAVGANSGCGGPTGPKRVPVSGTVKYEDGSIPTGAVTVIRFEPARAGNAADPNTKAASGTIQPDGSYQLTTVEENDGAFPGEYKVTFTVMKDYGDNISLVAPEFTDAATTPHSATVTLDGKNKFDFTIKPRK
jgi:hypothetical protein